jgi:signal transduction histidine kinase
VAVKNAEVLSAPAAIDIAAAKPSIVIAAINGALDEAYLLHDLKNHLQVIGSALNIVQRGVESGTPGIGRQAMTVAHAALEKACAVIITLTNRKVAGDADSTSDVDQLLSDMLPLIRVVMGSDVQVGLDCAAPHALDTRTAKQFENAVLNLALNAREAMPSGGRLEVTSRIVRGTTAGDRSALCIAVRDTGMGMDAQALTSAGHDRFTTRPGRGGGLGLASIRDFACSAGGRFDIESEKGVGTTVRLQLPL